MKFTTTTWREQRDRNNLSAVRSRQKAKRRAEEAFRDVESLKNQIVDYKIKIATLETKKIMLENENQFYKNQILMNCIYLPPLKNTELLPKIELENEEKEKETEIILPPFENLCNEIK